MTDKNRDTLANAIRNLVVAHGTGSGVMAATMALGTTWGKRATYNLIPKVLAAQNAILNNKDEKAIGGLQASFNREVEILSKAFNESPENAAFASAFQLGLNAGKKQ